MCPCYPEIVTTREAQLERVRHRLRVLRVCGIETFGDVREHRSLCRRLQCLMDSETADADSLSRCPPMPTEADLQARDR